MSGGGIAAFYFLVIIVALLLNYFLASNASRIAGDKGYDERKWFHMCFWLGPFPYILVAAMPDLKMREKQDRTNALLEKLTESFDATAVKQSQGKKDDISTYLPEL